MPLSEHEQRLLEQMERALQAEDPRFATNMRNPRPAVGDKRRVALGVVAFLVGVFLLLAGVASQITLIGVLGFVAMLAGMVVSIRAFRGGAAQPTPAAKTRQNQAKPRGRRSGSSSLTDRMEDRWRRRRETGDF